MTDRIKSNEEITNEIQELISKGSFDQAIAAFLDLHPNDQVEVYDLLNPEQRSQILNRIDIPATAQLFNLQEDQDTLEAAESINIDRLADILDEMAPDEAADLLLDLPPAQAAEALRQMEDADEVRPLLQFPDETAGGRMTTEFIVIYEKNTAAQAIDRLREIAPESTVPYYIFVTDRSKALKGVAGLRELVVSPPNMIIKNIMNPEVIAVDPWMDQEEVSQVMAQYDLSALPVVNQERQLIGVITYDDIIDVIQEEATEDIYRLASVTDNEIDPSSPVGEQLRGRLPWLFLNMLTALFAAWVISNFEDIIALVASLAVFQSVVAGMGGNAASQSVAMFVRTIALGKTSSGKIRGMLFRQMLVGFLQGLILGGIVGVGVYFWKDNAYLGLVIGMAIVSNLTMAGIIGMFAPLGLKAIGMDPAMAGTVLVTAVTDSLGFFIVLSLAQLFLPQLL